MKKLSAVAVLALMASSLTMAQNIDDLYFSEQATPLNAQEKAALAIAQQWQGMAPGAALGPGGAVQYLYGAQQPTIVCAVLQVCDLVLQPGESVMPNGLHLGDKVRWSVDPAITGVGPTATQHLIIKPLDVGLDTALVVATDRRTYHLRLRSDRTAYMPLVSFVYPEDSQAKWEALREHAAVAQTQRVENTLPTGEYLGDLSFDYAIAGTATWKPLRVYNDGRKTILQLPTAMAQTEAPALLVVRRDGGLFSASETVMVNYRVQGDRYIVDTVFDKAILVAGVGGKQTRVTITRGRP